MRHSRLLCATLILASCRGGETSPGRRTLIDSRDTYDPRSLDPALSTDVPTGRAVSYVFDGLTQFTPDAKLEPGLAKTWEVSEDGLTYTFHLRSGVQFHDGKPLTARSVIRSFARVLDPTARGGRGWPLYPIRGARAYSEGKADAIAGLSAPTDTTVVVKLAEPLAIFPKLLAMPVAAIVPDSTGPDFGQHPVGSGPWKLVEWKHDDYLRFARNEHYWGGPPVAESLMARIIPEPSTSVAEFESGLVDVLIVPQGETREWEQTDEKKAMLQRAPALILYYVGINVTRGPLTDARVRRALIHAIDSRTILRELFGARGQLVAGVVPPFLDGSDTTRARYDYDPAKAKQLLAEAGHPTGVDVELWYSQDAIIARLAQAVQGYLNAANIRAKLVQREASSVREAARKGETDLVVKTWYADYPDGENFLYPLLHSANKGVGGNVSFYTNPAFDSLVTRSHREQNDTARATLYRKADALAYADAPLVPLFFSDDLFAVQPWIKNFRVPTIFTGQRWLDVSIAPVGR
jgi:oligopeptide transport system substrate-binding protein